MFRSFFSFFLFFYYYVRCEKKQKKIYIPEEFIEPLKETSKEWVSSQLGGIRIPTRKDLEVFMDTLKTKYSLYSKQSQRYSQCEKQCTFLNDQKLARDALAHGKQYFKEKTYTKAYHKYKFATMKFRKCEEKELAGEAEKGMKDCYGIVLNMAKQVIAKGKALWPPSPYRPLSPSRTHALA